MAMVPDDHGLGIDQIIPAKFLDAETATAPHPVNDEPADSRIPKGS